MELGIEIRRIAIAVDDLPRQTYAVALQTFHPDNPAI